MSTSDILIAAAATAALVAVVSGAVWWYRGLPHVQHRRRLKERERMIEGFRKHLPRRPGGGPSEPTAE